MPQRTRVLEPSTHPVPPPRASEIAAFGKAWTDQSMFRRDPTQLDEVWLYRLVKR